LIGNVFGEQKTMKEQIREQKRMIERSVRALERDRSNLEKDEKKLIAEIKKQAKANQMVNNEIYFTKSIHISCRHIIYTQTNKNRKSTKNINQNIEVI
jgi:hypothetical protein